MGVAFSVVGIAMLVGTPIDGALLGPKYQWWKVIVFCGVRPISQTRDLKLKFDL